MACHLHWRLRAVSTMSLVVGTLALYAFLNMSAVGARSTRARRLNEMQRCQPKEVPRKERCVYVRTHPSCRPEDGWIPYLEIHYCYLSQMEGVSTALFLLWIAILFGLMLVIAERFFCPSLELIAEYLRLPPCVAGATLLSFGNGAPDVFTQLAAISQGDSDTTSPGAIAMALSEPLGSGLFVGNIVFGLVVFFSGLNEVRVQRSYFLKDCLFYLGGVLTVFVFLFHGEVMVWEVALLAGYYLAFIIVTVLLSRGDEPVHADPRLHEVPHHLQPQDSYLRGGCICLYMCMGCEGRGGAVNGWAWKRGSPCERVWSVLWCCIAQIAHCSPKWINPELTPLLVAGLVASFAYTIVERSEYVVTTPTLGWELADSASHLRALPPALSGLFAEPAGFWNGLPLPLPSYPACTPGPFFGPMPPESFRHIPDLSVASQVSQISGADTDAEAPLLEGSSPKRQQQQRKSQPQQQKSPQLMRIHTLERIEEAAPGLAGESEDGGGRAAGIDGDSGGDDYGNDNEVDRDLELFNRLRAASRRGGGVSGPGISSSSSGAADARGGNLIGINHGNGSAINWQRSSESGSVGYKPPPPVLAATAAVTAPSVFNDDARSADSASSLAFYRQFGSDGSFTCGSCRGSLDPVTAQRREDSGKPPGRMEQLWRRLERPVLALLSLFIPRVAIDTHARYRKTCAVLLPPLLPTLAGWVQGWLGDEHSPGGFWRQTWWLGSTSAGLVVAVAALRFYPRKGHLHGYAAGIATVVVFCEAMFLLDASAGELVSAAVALGQIFGINPSLLGATLLAWGNSVSDLVSNITLAKDGLPSMAITACFASPMFVLLAGLVTSLTYATRHGNMELPQDLALKALYGCSCSILLMWALVVPLVFRFRLTRRVGVLAVTVYLVYQTVYIWAIIHDSRGRG
ncbi:hypothetical protein Vretimale_11525 [Volvox reticuliferus]|uniref:Sodium/calcium exchanger membrane region domain-containing protein n=1 Tax=Volvox reticuliferus TaxID=1737510 RepID=A0A8J4LRT7_9CHLO|nr:hypothetical protein Vretimale_11525 [Volvox reticuliferus]